MIATQFFKNLAKIIDLYDKLMQMYIEMANSEAHHVSKQYMQMKIKDNYTERYRGGKLFVVSNSMKGILEKKSGCIN